jgi:ABC-2 type transport system permease protein
MRMNIRAMLHTVKVHMKLSMARPMFQFVILIQPFMFATIGILIYGEAESEHIFHYVALGSGFMTLWSSIVFSSASDVNRERLYGALELIFVAPTSFANTLVGKIIGNTILGILSMMISIIYLLIFFRIRLEISEPFLFVLSFLFVIVTLSVFAFFLAMAFTLSRKVEMLMNSIEYPIYLICGFMFPISHLPDWAEPISWVLPPTWAIQLLREVSRESITFNHVWQPFSCLVLVTILYLMLAKGCYILVEKKVRIKGTLGVY